MANRSLNALHDELIAQIKVVAIDDFQDRIFSVFDMEEVAARIQNQGFPVVLVAYEGMDPNEGNQGLNARGTPVTASQDTLLVNVRFSVIVAVEYYWNNEVDDQKRNAMDLLSSIRGQLIGFMGVNNKPWRFVTEGPISDSLDGVILYAQMWETTTVEQTTRQ